MSASRGVSAGRGGGRGGSRVFSRRGRPVGSGARQASGDNVSSQESHAAVTATQGSPLSSALSAVNSIPIPIVSFESIISKTPILENSHNAAPPQDSNVGGFS